MKNYARIKTEELRPIELICDACGKKAEWPEDFKSRWIGAGIKFNLTSSCWIDGDDMSDDFDLCPECFEKAKEVLGLKGRFDQKPQEKKP